MAREGMIAIPQNGNNGHSLDGLRKQIIAALISSFGGATAVNAMGYWQSPNGELFQEPITQLVSAYEPTPENDSKLKAIAERIGKDGSQLAVYVRYASGNVEILNTEGVQPWSS